MIGDPRFAPHNLHLDDPDVFRAMDPQLRELKRLPIAYRYPMLGHLPVDRPGVYSITGGRRVGKSTVLKQWVADLLDAGVRPQRILYLTGELIDDHHALVSLLGRITPDRSPTLPAYLLIDEVTYIRDWDRGVKYLADAGLLEDVVLVLTGSDSVIIREARARLPGRRGREARVDFHLYPLSFAEYLSLGTAHGLEGGSDDAAPGLIAAFERYLMHGGFLTAINDLEAHGRILPATFAVYGDWIRGDMIKRGKQERYLAEIVGSVIRRYGSQVTWPSLAADLSVDHPMTVADYLQLLAQMDVLIVQYALREDRLAPAPKKARKVGILRPVHLPRPAELDRAGGRSVCGSGRVRHRRPRVGRQTGRNVRRSSSPPHAPHLLHQGRWRGRYRHRRGFDVPPDRGEVDGADPIDRPEAGAEVPQQHDLLEACNGPSPWAAQ